MAAADNSAEAHGRVVARRWEVVLDEIFDSLSGESLRLVPSVCRYWRECCASPDRCEQRWKTVISREFSIPSSAGAELLIWGSRYRPDLPQELADSHQPFFDLWRQLKAKGWWAAEGLDAQDYVSKFFSAQIIGFSRSGTAGHSPTAPSDHPIAQQVLIPPGGCRVLVHFEGWTERWDEWLVLPTEAHRLRPHRPCDPRITGKRSTRDCVLGSVRGLEVAQEDGSIVPAAVVGMGTAPSQAEEKPGEGGVRGWGDVDVQLLLRYGDGRQEWLDLSDEAQRSRINEHTRPYPTLCGCETCLRVIRDSQAPGWPTWADR